jgi:fibronectin type 3 domain-containing protein
VKKISFLFILLFATVSLIAQNASRVLLRNAGIQNGRQSISVKWYSPELYFNEGISIYRKEGKGEWQKLNSKPVRKQTDLPASEYEKDGELDYFIPLVNEIKKEDLQGLVLYQVLLKTWESETFSKFLGVQFTDSTVLAGKTYTYKVNRIKGNTEESIAEAIITAGPETFGEPVKEISIQADTNKAKIKWRPEEQRFFAVNIYRSNNTKDWLKVNERPLVITKYRDTLGNLKYPEVFYIEDSLAIGIHYYQLAGVDFFGKETKPSEPIKIQIKDLIPPPAPEALKDSVRNLDVYLKWSNPYGMDIVGINIYRSVKSTGPFIKINKESLPPLTAEYKDKVDKPGPYYYYVATVDQAGNEGKSRPTFAEVHDIVPPAKPTGLIAKSDTGRIQLSWQKNKEQDVTGYMIYRTSNKNDKNNFVLLNAHPVKENSYTDKLPMNARNKFLYKILAIDSSYNKSDYSEIVSVQMPDIIPPVKPLIKNINNVENTIIIEWIPNKDADLNGYNIYRSQNSKEYAKLNQQAIPLNETNYKDGTVNSGSTYYYYLTAVDSAGNESQPSGIQKGYNNFTSLKSKPEEIKFKYKEDKNELQITWKQEQSEELLGCVIYRKEKEADNLLPLSEKVKGNEYTDRSIQKGKTYYYEIRAYDKMGNIIRSETKKVTIKN